MQAKFILIAIGITCFLFQEGNAQEGFCLEPFVEIADKCYKFHQMTMDWHSAEMACGREGARLASVLTNEQYTGLLGHINGNFAGTYWISGVPRNGQWVWGALEDSTPMASGWWGYGRAPPATPGQCSYFCSHTHKYWAKSCSSQVRFICEKNLMVLREVDPEQTVDELEPLPFIKAQ